VRATPNRAAIATEMADIDRQDNQELAQAAQTMAQALQILGTQLPGHSDTLRRLVLRLVMRFAGEPLDEPVIDTIFRELDENPDDDGRGAVPAPEEDPDA
jgi:hypothetical protein